MSNKNEKGQINQKDHSYQGKFVHFLSTFIKSARIAYTGGHLSTRI